MQLGILLNQKCRLNWFFVGWFHAISLSCIFRSRTTTGKFCCSADWGVGGRTLCVSWWVGVFLDCDMNYLPILALIPENLSTFRTGFATSCSWRLKQGEELKAGRKGQGQLVFNVYLFWAFFFSVVFNAFEKDYSFFKGKEKQEWRGLQTTYFAYECYVKWWTKEINLKERENNQPPLGAGAELMLHQVSLCIMH